MYTMRTEWAVLGARWHIATAAAIVAAIPAAGVPADLTRLGPVYPVIEQDILVMIESRLKSKDATGEISLLMNEARSRASGSVTSPAPVAGLTACAAPRTFYFDPSVLLTHDVKDQAGRVLVAKGTRRNPLDIVAMARPLLFFDARDMRQRDFAWRMLKEKPVQPKLVLVGGSYLELMRQWRIPVFYDQQGRLSRQLGLKQVPALVSQQGKRLRIDEMKVSP